MRQVTATGQTVDEAIQSALKQLNITEDQASIEIIDEGKKKDYSVYSDQSLRLLRL